MENKQTIKSFVIVIDPCSAGSAFGYIAKYSKYQFWNKTRMGVITDMLDMLDKRFKRQLSEI